jgi:hypothetical protein
MCVNIADPDDADVAQTGQTSQRTAQDLIDGLAELRLLAIRLDLKVVGAIISSAVGMIPVTKH